MEKGDMSLLIYWGTDLVTVGILYDEFHSKIF